ncbi:alpha/beta fold hydrolase [Hydrogenophaga aquatica]
MTGNGTGEPIPCYQETGSEHSARPALVFLHGIGGGSAGWHHQQQAFAQQGYHTLAWEMPGYGRSPLIAPYDFPGLAEALRRMLDAARVERAILIGHSLGGMVALQAWTVMPERIQAMVLAATSPAFGHGSGDFQQQFLAQRLAPLDAGQTLAQVAERLVPAMAAPNASAASLAEAKACMGAIPPASYRAALQALVTFEQRAALPTITVPTLCLAAEHDRTAAPSVMQRMAARIPGAQYVEIAGAGHLVNFERPDAFNAAVADFLDTLSSTQD